MDLVNCFVNAIKADKNEGEDSPLLEVMGYIIKSRRKSDSMHDRRVQPDSHSQSRMSGQGMCQIHQAGRAGLVRPFSVFDATGTAAAARANARVFLDATHLKRIFPPVMRIEDAHAYMCAIRLSPNSEHLICVAPSICRAKSYVTRLLPMAPLRPLRIKSATSVQPR